MVVEWFVRYFAAYLLEVNHLPWKLSEVICGSPNLLTVWSKSTERTALIKHLKTYFRVLKMLSAPLFRHFEVQLVAALDPPSRSQLGFLFSFRASCFFRFFEAVNVLLQEKSDWDTAKKVLNRLRGLWGLSESRRRSGEETAGDVFGVEINPKPWEVHDVLLNLVNSS